MKKDTRTKTRHCQYVIFSVEVTPGCCFWIPASVGMTQACNDQVSFVIPANAGIQVCFLVPDCPAYCAVGALRVSDNQVGDSPEARDSPRAKP